MYSILMESKKVKISSRKSSASSRSSQKSALANLVAFAHIDSDILNEEEQKKVKKGLGVLKEEPTEETAPAEQAAPVVNCEDMDEDQYEAKGKSGVIIEEAAPPPNFWDNVEPALIEPTEEAAPIVNENEEPALIEPAEEAEEEPEEPEPDEIQPPEETEEERELRELLEEDEREKKEQLKKAREREEKIARLKFKKEIQPLRDVQIKRFEDDREIISQRILYKNKRIQELQNEIKLIEEERQKIDDEILKISNGGFDAELIEEKILELRDIRKPKICINVKTSKTTTTPTSKIEKILSVKTAEEEAETTPTPATAAETKKERAVITRPKLSDVIRQPTRMRLKIKSAYYYCKTTDGEIFTNEADNKNFTSLNKWSESNIKAITGTDDKTKKSVYKVVEYHNVKNNKWVVLGEDWNGETTDFNKP